VNREDVGRLFAYDAWANRRLLRAASDLSARDFTRDLGASFGSVRGTFLHIMWGEKRYLHFWRTRARIDDAKVDDYPDVASLLSAWAAIETERCEFADSLSDEALDSRLTLRGHEYALRHLVQHVANHSTYHRGQVVLLLRQLGQVPPATDYALFLREGR
jgi:uncharacterized damage-inducible protein DinB